MIKRCVFLLVPYVLWLSACAGGPRPDRPAVPLDPVVAGDGMLVGFHLTEPAADGRPRVVVVTEDAARVYDQDGVLVAEEVPSSGRFYGSLVYGRHFVVSEARQLRFFSDELVPEALSSARVEGPCSDLSLLAGDRLFCSTDGSLSPENEILSLTGGTQLARGLPFFASAPGSVGRWSYLVPGRDVVLLFGEALSWDELIPADLDALDGARPADRLGVGEPAAGPIAFGGSSGSEIISADGGLHEITACMPRGTPPVGFCLEQHGGLGVVRPERVFVANDPRATGVIYMVEGDATTAGSQACMDHVCHAQRIDTVAREVTAEVAFHLEEGERLWPVVRFDAHDTSMVVAVTGGCGGGSCSTWAIARVGLEIP